MRFNYKIILAITFVIFFSLVFYVKFNSRKVEIVGIDKKQQTQNSNLNVHVGTSTLDSKISPDGKFSIEIESDGFVSCCGGEKNVPNSKMWLKNLTSGAKFVVQRPNPTELGGRVLMRFKGWYPDSSGIMIYFQSPDEVTQGSDIYKVDLRGGLIGIDKSQSLPEIY